MFIALQSVIADQRPGKWAVIRVEGETQPATQEFNSKPKWHNVVWQFGL